MKLKICGIRTSEALSQCLALEVDYIGINFVKVSKRRAKTSFYPVIAKQEMIQKVGVFQDQTVLEITRLAQETNLDVIQLHGKEDSEFIDQLRLKCPEKKVWKAFSVNQNFDPHKLQQYSKNCDLFLFDGENPGSGSQIVDNQKLLDALFESEKLGIPYGLAGGINTENVDQYTEDFPKAFLLDTASGAETAGSFDPQKALILRQKTQ